MRRPLDPRRSWYWNLDHVAARGNYDVVFRLKQPQPAFLAQLSSGYSPAYPCHVTPQVGIGHSGVPILRPVVKK